MVATVVSLVSILVGVIAANVFGFVFRKHAFDSIGNSIAGVFGSVFLMKTFRLLTAMTTISKKQVWLVILVSIIGSIVMTIMLKQIQVKIFKNN